MSELMVVPPDAATVQRANALKDEGNALLTQGHWNHAIEKYNEAIDIMPTAIFLSNRAHALIKMEAYGQAIQDANEALRLDPKYIKAYYRRGSANFALGKLKQAVKDFKAVVAIVPKDVDAQNKLKACERMIKAEAFAKAIESDVPPESTVDVNSFVVEGSYTGPHIPYSDKGEPVYTVQFVMQCMEYMKGQNRVHKKYVLQVLLSAIQLFMSLPSLLEVSIPRIFPDIDRLRILEADLHDTHQGERGSFNVCGDTHGQFYDLLNIFNMAGLPSESNSYLFNGDYVDRGSFSFETVFTLLLWKLALPNSMHMLRGNHETKNMNKIYGFEGEVKHKYDDTVMSLFTRVFQALPLAAVLEKQVFVVHGGLSTQDGGFTLQDVRNISRFNEPSESGLMSDLLWSDPQPQRGKAPSKRGMGFSFGPDYTQNFLNHNGLSLVIRSHEVRDQGWAWDHTHTCMTVFSAPNYCDQMGNKGAYIVFQRVGQASQSTQDKGEVVYSSETCSARAVTFDCVSHPNVPPMAYAGNMFGL